MVPLTQLLGLATLVAGAASLPSAPSSAEATFPAARANRSKSAAEAWDALRVAIDDVRPRMPPRLLCPEPRRAILNAM